MIGKTYQPSAVEGRIYAKWEEAGAFRAGRPERRDARPYCIVIPPPNVTGLLHMGHALNNTLQDVLVLRAHARPRRAVAARHRSRRHRHPNGGRTPAHGAPGATAARARAGKIS